MNSLNENGRDSRDSSCKKLYVRYMVSTRCKSFAISQLKNLGIDHQISIEGAIKLPLGITPAKYEQLKKSLEEGGLQLLNESESILIDRIITTIMEIIHHTDTLPKVCFSELIHENLGHQSESILKIFSEVKGVSITQFIIQQKIERAKELLLYYDLSLAEISEKLCYRSENYFVSQFKKFTDLSPSYFLELKDRRAANMAHQ